jgi:hypothetical protein
VLLHYSAYGYSHFGYPAWLFQAIADWRRRSDRRLVVMFHEIWSFSPFWNKNFFVQRLHRNAIQHLIQQADATFTSTVSQAGYLNLLRPRSPAKVLPVGSNITPTEQAAPRLNTLSVLFGKSGSRLAALRRLHKGLLRLARLRRITEIVSVGVSESTADFAQEQELLASLYLQDGFRQLGPLSEADVSSTLNACAFGISGQDKQSHTKSGTFMAYAAHALNIIWPGDPSPSEEPAALLLDVDTLTAGIAEADLERRALALRRWYEQTASWPHIAATFDAALNSAAPRDRADV